jgi:hypothetical protein
MSEKPLHVQVAEALGWMRDGTEWTIDRKGYFGRAPEGTTNAHGFRLRLAHVPHYDTDWSATGPLIEKYHLHLGESIEYEDKGAKHRWFAGGWDSTEDRLSGYGPTPLIATCHAILELKKAGLL